MRRILLILVLSIVWAATMAQTATISGRVTDAESSEIVAGANIAIKGTTKGTFADAQGRFSLSVPTGAVLVFSSIGIALE